MSAGRNTASIDSAPASVDSSKSFSSSVAIGLGTNGLLAVVTLGSGVLTARALDPGGRGVLTAVLTLIQITSLITGSGIGPALSFHLAKDERRRQRDLTTGLAISFALGLIGAGLGYGALFSFLHAESPQIWHASVIFVSTVPVFCLTSTVIAGVQGVAGYRFAALLALLTGSLYLLLLVALYNRPLTPSLAILSYVVSNLIVTAIGFVWLRRHIGFGRVSIASAKTQLSYFARLIVTLVTHVISARLDIILLPLFVANAQVGYYAVAGGIAFLVYTLPSYVSTFMLPEALRRKELGVALMARGIRVMLLLSTILALMIAAVAAPAVRVIYGSSFAPAITPLLILLPGMVLLAGLQQIFTVLMARERPGLTSIPALVGLIVMVPGLMLFLPTHGITAAASVSTVAAAWAFATAVVVLRLVEPESLEGLWRPRRYWEDVWLMVSRAAVLGSRFHPRARNGAIL